MMAALRDPRVDLLESVTRMMGALYRDAGFEEVAQHVEYDWSNETVEKVSRKKN